MSKEEIEKKKKIQQLKKRKEEVEREVGMNQVRVLSKATENRDANTEKQQVKRYKNAIN